MDEILEEQSVQKAAPPKMTISNASTSEPIISLNESNVQQNSVESCPTGLTNGNTSSELVLNSISQSSSHQNNGSSSQAIGSSADKQSQKHKSSSSHKPSPSSSSKERANTENQNGFTKPKDPHHSSSSSSNKSRDHSSSSSSSKEKEKHHGLSLSSSSHRDNHSSSKSKEHSSSSSSGSSSKHRDSSSGGTSKEGSSSKHRDGGLGDSSGREHSSSKSKDGSSRDGKSSSSSDSSALKSHSSSSLKSPSTSSSKLSSSHKDKPNDSSRSEASKSKDGSVGKSSEKHHHKSCDSDAKSRTKLNSESLASPLLVKHEVESPTKSASKADKRIDDDDDDDTPLFARSQKLENVKVRDSPKKVKDERERGDDDEDDAPLFSRLQKVKPKIASDDDDDIPLMSRLDKKIKVKTEIKPLAKKRKHEDSGDESDEPLSARMEKVKKLKTETKSKPGPASSKKRNREDDDYSPKKHKEHINKKSSVKEEQASPKKGRKKQEDEAAEETKWKWWEDESKNDDDGGVKWKTLEHKGPIFAPPYEPLPNDVKFYYDGKAMKLSEPTEEIATFYGRMLDHDYTTRELFNKNFFKDWRKVMTGKEREILIDLRKCNFKEIDAHFKRKSEERKNMSKEEKQVLKKENEKLLKEYGFCIIDNHKQKIGNFKIEPPGLFRGRGDHPKQGMLKKRTQPEDVTINCSKGAKVPPPPSGHKWKEIRHDNTVTWLASWSENIQGSNKYIMLNAASKLKGEKDWMKYETARRLHKCVDKIRKNYREDWKSKEMKIRQRSVALYFIDKLALRAGNEKDEDTADTVGCCSLRVEHIKLYDELDGKECVVEFDFLGKDSIRYYNTVAIEKRVFKNLQLFMENKQDGDDVFDRLNTGILNKHLQNLMDGLTAKVFRTYNASRTLQEQLDLLTNAEDSIPEKLLSYNRANRAVAVLCNHQRAAPKNFDKQMENLQSKIDAKKDAVKAAKKDVKDAKADYKARHSETAKSAIAKKQKALERVNEQLAKLEVQATDKDENKEIALGTSKLNYLDPRISIAWCKKWNVPIEKCYNKTQRDKFAWAIDMADKDYHF